MIDELAALTVTVVFARLLEWHSAYEGRELGDVGVPLPGTPPREALGHVMNLAFWGAGAVNSPAPAIMRKPLHRRN